MTLGAGAAVDVDLFRIQAEFLDWHHGDHSEGFVDLEQVNVFLAPAGFGEQGFDGANRGAGELGGVLGLGAMANNPGQGFEAALFRLGFAHQQQCGGAVGDGGGVGGGHGTVFLEGRTQARDLVDVGVVGLFVILDDDLTLAGLHGHRDDFLFQQAFLDGFLGAGQGLDGVLVHLLAAVAFLVRHILGESAHQAAGLGVFQAVQKHVVLRGLAGAHAVAFAGTQEDIGSVGHALHATGDHDVVAAGLDQVVGEHGGFHAGAAQLVDGGGAGVIRQTGQTHGLTGRALLESGGQDVAHDDFLNVGWLKTSAFDGLGNGDGAEFGGGNVRQAAHEAAHGGADAAYDYYVVVAHVSWTSRFCLWLGSDERFHLTSFLVFGLGGWFNLGSDQQVDQTPELGLALGSEESFLLTPCWRFGSEFGSKMGSDERVHQTPGVFQTPEPTYGLCGASRYSWDCISSNRDSVRSNSKLRRPPE